MEIKLWVWVIWIKEEFEASEFPFSYEIMEKEFEAYLSKFKFSETSNIDFKLIEETLKKIVSEWKTKNSAFLKSVEKEDKEHFETILKSINSYWENRIQEIIENLQNPKQQVWFFKSIFAKILN